MLGRSLFFSLFVLSFFTLPAQSIDWDARIEAVLPAVIDRHRAFVSLPNVSSDREDVRRNLAWARAAFEARGFSVSLLEAPGIPVFLAERRVEESAPTLLFYLHIDGQAVNPANWDQDDPFVPVLKRAAADGSWEAIPWSSIGEGIDPEWRIFGRAAADDKGPITMLLAALELLEEAGQAPAYNVKVVLDPEEEAG